MTTQQIAIELNDEVASRIAQLPSATTIGERQFAVHYAAKFWDGKRDVFENGPLLGGSTRALALGMLFNENRDRDALLHTYDWFSLREPLDLPENVWGELVAAGLLDDRTVERAEADGSFLPIFRELHHGEDYGDLVRPHVGYLPGHRGEVPEHGEKVFETPEWGPFGLAFVDGCKSWYGTKHWFRELLPRLVPGADFMFQDFGHYTCFWIPSLIGTFREHFELQAYVDYTYVWRLKTLPSRDEVESRFPDEPTDFSREKYDEVFAGLLREASDRGDRWAVMVLQMQHAAAYAYLGLLDEARGIIDALLMQAEWMPHRQYLKAARRSPTYRPPNEEILL